MNDKHVRLFIDEGRHGLQFDVAVEVRISDDELDTPPVEVLAHRRRPAIAKRVSQRDRHPGDGLSLDRLLKIAAQPRTHVGVGKCGGPRQSDRQSHEH